MAVRALNICLIALLLAAPVQACFGPKLYLGVGTSSTDRVLAAFVAIYVKESTGTDVVRVPLDGKEPTAEIVAEQIDFAFADDVRDGTVRLLTLKSLPVLVSGPRIDGDLQFTTVRPALEKLEGRLQPEMVRRLTARVEAGELAMDVVRHFLIERSWI